jgi:hypothetical protein
MRLVLFKFLIRSFMTYTSPTWEYAADSHLFKLQRLQNRVFRAIEYLHKCKLLRELHVAFEIPYMYYHINKLCSDTGRINPKPCTSKCTWYWTNRTQT